MSRSALAATREPGDIWYYFIVVSIYISIFFNSYTFFTTPFEFYIGYLAFIALLPVFIFRYGFNRELILIFFVLLITGIYHVVLGNNTTGQLTKIFLGLFFSYLFYFYVILEFKFNVEQLFKWYLKGAYIASLIGLFQFVSFLLDFRPGYYYGAFLNKWNVIPGGNFGIRINSIFGEPTYLGAVMSAAFFVSVKELIARKHHYLTRFQCIAIIAVYFLSFSGLGQIGIFLTFIFLLVNYGLVRYMFVFIPLLIWFFGIMYENVADFRDRYDSLIELFTTGNFVLGKTHGSSFILYNNFRVAIENFSSNFIFGTGLGSHPTAFEKYSVAKSIMVYGLNLNSADANSMFLRLLSETGLFGVSIMLFIIIKCYIPRNENVESYHWIVSNSILILILLNMFRQGHYFLNGFPFFVLLYIYNYFLYSGKIPEPGTADHEAETTDATLAEGKK
jgi:hypothetical protein